MLRALAASLLFLSLHTAAASETAPSLAEQNAGLFAALVFLAVMGGVLFLLGCAHIYVGGFVRGKPPKTPKQFLVADALFYAIDTDGSGTIEPAELLEYLLKRGETPSSTHALLQRLDLNNDGKIDLDEWRKGWLAGFVGPDMESGAAAAESQPGDEPKPEGKAQRMPAPEAE